MIKKIESFVSDLCSGSEYEGLFKGYGEYLCGLDIPLLTIVDMLTELYRRLEERYD